jgi:hypothetical protein
MPPLSASQYGHNTLFTHYSDFLPEMVTSFFDIAGLPDSKKHKKR